MSVADKRRKQRQRYITDKEYARAAAERSKVFHDSMKNDPIYMRVRRLCSTEHNIRRSIDRDTERAERNEKRLLRVVKLLEAARQKYKEHKCTLNATRKNGLPKPAQAPSEGGCWTSEPGTPRTSATAAL